MKKINKDKNIELASIKKIFYMHKLLLTDKFVIITMCWFNILCIHYLNRYIKCKNF